MSIFTNIKLIAMDVDGVLTDGSIIMSSTGEEMKAFSVHDGVGIKLAHLSAMTTAVITGRSSSVVVKRAKELGINEIYQDVADKELALEDLLEKYKLKDYQVAYIGDDLNDLKVMRRVGLKIATLNAVREIKDIADFITEFEGGKGAVRDAINAILEKKGVLADAINKYCSLK